MLPKWLRVVLLLIFLGAVAKLAIVDNFPNILGVSTPSKKAYTIAIFGDSMVDTMGEKMDILQIALKRKYPGITFTLYNYGIGSENIEDGLARFNSPFNNKTRSYPPVSSLHPDILIIGSFAYNPFYPYDRNRHWQGLSRLVKEAQNTGSDIYVLSEIAPLRFGFGKGKTGVNWDENKAFEHASHILELLENAIYLAKDHLKVPLIDVYSASTIKGKFGNGRLVEPNDGIHPSFSGHQLMAEIIAQKIKLR